MKEVGISIIIVSYNKLTDTTEPCLESIFQHGQGLDYEVIVVDNDSQDGTREYLKQTAATHESLRWIANPSNLGYAIANNIGIKAARGRILVLLNSDTQITPHSLDRLASFLRDHPDVGLAGPVTNSAGNEQMIFTTNSTVAEILAEGQRWTDASPGDFFETERLGFFCVAMRHDHLQRVGMLDESFGLGFFEDDDYCLRSRQAGYRLVCLEDVFVYHRGSASFKQHSSDATKALMKKNRRLFETKHALRYRPSAARDRQLELAGGYLRLAKDNSRLRLVFKTENRLRVARNCLPRNVLTRMRFIRLCSRLQREASRIKDVQPR